MVKGRLITLIFKSKDTIAFVDQASFSLAGFTQVFLIMRLGGLELLGGFSEVWYFAILVETFLNAIVVQGAVVSSVNQKQFSPKELFLFYGVGSLVLSGIASTIFISLFAEDFSFFTLGWVFIFIATFHLPAFTRKMIYLVGGSESGRDALIVTVFCVWSRPLLFFISYHLGLVSEVEMILVSLTLGSLVGIVYLFRKKWFPGLSEIRRFPSSFYSFFKLSKNWYLVTQGALEWLCFMGPMYLISSLYGPLAAGLYVATRTIGTSLNLLTEIFITARVKEAIALRNVSFKIFLGHYKRLFSVLLMSAFVLIGFVVVFQEITVFLLFGGVPPEHAVLAITLGVLVQLFYSAFMIAKSFMRVNCREFVNTAFSLILFTMFLLGLSFDLTFIEYYSYYSFGFGLTVCAYWLASFFVRPVNVSVI